MPARKIKDQEDSGRRGKKLERAFSDVVKLAGLKIIDGGLTGVNGALWDFKPSGLGWSNLPDNAEVNLKDTGSRNLWTSSSVWRDLFNKTFQNETEAKKIAKTRLNKVGFHRVYWLYPKTKEVGNKVISISQSNNKRAASEILKQKNWSVKKIGSYDIELTMERKKITMIHIIVNGQKWARVKVRANKNARSTGASAIKGSAVPPQPFKSLKKEKLVRKLTKLSYNERSRLIDTVLSSIR